MWCLSLYVIDETSKESSRSHEARCLSVSPVIVNGVLHILLQLLFLLIFSSWRLNVVLDIPVAGQCLDVVNIFIQSLHNIILRVRLLEKFNEQFVSECAPLKFMILNY